jgi:protein SCO1/2
MTLRIVIALVCLATGARAQDTRRPPPVGIEEKLGQTIPLDLTFSDESGNPVVLRDIITKPTIVTFVYFRCPGICSPLLNELSRMVDKMDLVPGTDYQIMTLSFDHREKSDMAAEKKDNYLSTISRSVPPTAWRFLTGDSAQIRTLTDAAGFYFKRDHEDWIHAGALIMLSPEGKITRYINGVSYLPFDVKMAVLEASHGTVTPTIATVLKFCYSYDPEGRTYALNVTRIAMVLILLLVAVFAMVFLVIPRMKKSERHLRYDKST